MYSLIIETVRCLAFSFKQNSFASTTNVRKLLFYKHLKDTNYKKQKLFFHRLVLILGLAKLL